MKQPKAPVMLWLPGGTLRRAEGVEAVTLTNQRAAPWHAVDAFTDLTLCGRDSFTATQMYREWSDTPEAERCRVCHRADLAATRALTTETRTP